MAKSHGRSEKKPTGAKKKAHRDKRKAELGRERQEVTIGKTLKKVVKGRGSTRKIALKQVEEANVLDPATHKAKKVKIISVKENKANRHYVRRNVVTLGAIIETEMGLARVTSRPVQEGIVNAVLIKK
ncbi:MAG: 30S ribosomal protein S8e [Candidatus Diapherotrites archaeon]|nr:30S ribosomal protein S8e [Candidatus Diapherotrites archaeon]